MIPNKRSLISCGGLEISIKYSFLVAQQSSWASSFHFLALHFLHTLSMFSIWISSCSLQLLSGLYWKAVWTACTTWTFCSCGFYLTWKHMKSLPNNFLVLSSIAIPGKLLIRTQVLSYESLCRLRDGFWYSRCSQAFTLVSKYLWTLWSWFVRYS